MTRKGLAAASAALVAAMLVAALVVGARLPADARLPIHWGLSGEADGFAGKWVALLMPVGTTGAVSLLFLFLPALEPRAKGLERSQGLYLWGWAAVLFMCAVLHFAVLATALDWGVPVPQLVIGGCGVMLATIGNQLGKSRSMYLIGLRTPWTLASEEVWIKTHRLAGKLMVLGGLVMLAAAVLRLPASILATLVLAVLVVASGVPILYSLILWRREQRESQSSAYRSTAE
jgi:uncharacterized membrane protein